jgi:hypothetical protein
VLRQPSSASTRWSWPWPSRRCSALDSHGCPQSRCELPLRTDHRLRQSLDTQVSVGTKNNSGSETALKTGETSSNGAERLKENGHDRRPSTSRTSPDSSQMNNIQLTANKMCSVRSGIIKRMPVNRRLDRYACALQAYSRNGSGTHLERKRQKTQCSVWKMGRCWCTTASSWPALHKLPLQHPHPQHRIHTGRLKDFSQGWDTGVGAGI